MIDHQGRASGVRSREEPSTLSTPYVVLDTNRVIDAYTRLCAALPVDRVHYAMKCNPAPAVLAEIAQAGGSFEVASFYELKQLIELGIDVRKEEVLFSHPIKRPADIAAAHAAGVAAFAFDSVEEIEKIERSAPCSSVYVRIAALSGASQVPSEGKFGVDTDTALKLLRQAAEARLDPCGIAFHVGSQMTDCDAWSRAIGTAGRLIEQCHAEGIGVRLLNIGGGFPVSYSDPVPDIEIIGKSIRRALAGLPSGMQVVCEPGRYIVAEAGEIVTEVLGVAERFGRRDAHLDVGALNGLLEELETDAGLRYPVSDSRRDVCQTNYRLTGPSCDGKDLILESVRLSASLRAGDLVRIRCAGAYTWSYTEDFNGFPRLRQYATASPKSQETRPIEYGVAHETFGHVIQQRTKADAEALLSICQPGAKLMKRTSSEKRGIKSGGMGRWTAWEPVASSESRTYRANLKVPPQGA